MKKTLKLMPEYQCYPLWLYDSDGTLIEFPKACKPTRN